MGGGIVVGWAVAVLIGFGMAMLWMSWRGGCAGDHHFESTGQTRVDVTPFHDPKPWFMVTEEGVKRCSHDGCDEQRSDEIARHVVHENDLLEYAENADDPR